MIQNPPSDGTLSTVGALGVNLTPELGFDVSGATGTAYAATRIARGSSILRTINLSTGAATLVGPIGDGARLDGLAVLPAEATD